MGRAGDRLCRLLNIVVAAVLAALAAPLMMLIALAVKITSRGPVLYRQRRVGHDRRRRGAAEDSRPLTERRRENVGGRLFTMLKFRSMHDRGAEAAADVRACLDDPRVTPLGRVLRQHRLDELPQLFNVLAGHMNVVGPRPEQPALFKELEAHLAGYASRQSVLPGITGWAQVNRGYDRTVDDVRHKVELDLEYIRLRSPVEDLNIMARTLPVMIFKRGSL